MSLMIEEFGIKELRARPLGGKLLHGMKTINFYFGDDHKRVSNVLVYGRMKVAKGKFGQYLEIDIDEESERFFKSLKENLSRVAKDCLNEKPWDFKSFIIEYGPLYSICCKVYSSCKMVNMKVGEYFRGHCENINPTMCSVAKPRESHSSPTKSSNDIYPSWINIPIPECNQEAALYPQELTSALLIQMLSWVHPSGNTSHDCLRLQRFLSICKFSWTTPYPLLYVSDHRVLHRVVIGTDTIHPQVIYLLQDRPLI